MDERKKVVLITGCSSGIGESCANAFHKNGYIVYQTARNKKDLDGREGKDMRVLRLDVTKGEEIHEAVEEIIKKDGKIDVLVNNAGYSYFGPMMEVPVDELKKIYDVNIHGVLRMIHEVAPHMMKRGSGLILNITSVSAILPSIFAGSYCSSKSATSMMTNIMRQELRLFGIKVVDVQPGAIKSKFAENAEKLLKEDYKYYEKYRSNVITRVVQGQHKASTSKDFAKDLVKIVDVEDLNEIPYLIVLGSRSKMYRFLGRFCPTEIADRLTYKTFGVKNTQMGSLITFKQTLKFAFYLFLIVFFIRIFIF